jgi:hypothetical protein
MSLNPKVKLWLDCALAAFVSGVANSFVLAIGIPAGQLIGINVQALNLRQLCATTVIGGIISVARYVQQSPIPVNGAPVDGGGLSDVMKNKLPLLLVMVLATALCGCAFLHSKTTRSYSVVPGGQVTNVVETTVATAYTLWDAQSSLAKFRNQSSPSSYGTNTFAPGTSLSALEQSSSSTNINGLAGAVVGAAVQAAIAGAK